MVLPLDNGLPFSIAGLVSKASSTPRSETPRAALTLEEADALIRRSDEKRRRLPTTRFYIYDERDGVSWDADLSRVLRTECLEALKGEPGQYLGELFFLRQLRNHRWRTLTSSEADIFVVPAFLSVAIRTAEAGRAKARVACNYTYDHALKTLQAANATAFGEDVQRSRTWHWHLTSPHCWPADWMPLLTPSNESWTSTHDVCERSARLERVSSSPRRGDHLHLARSVLQRVADARWHPLAFLPRHVPVRARNDRHD